MGLAGSYAVSYLCSFIIRNIDIPHLSPLQQVLYEITLDSDFEQVYSSTNSSIQFNNCKLADNIANTGGGAMSLVSNSRTAWCNFPSILFTWRRGLYSEFPCEP